MAIIIGDILAKVLLAVFNRPYTNYWLRNAPIEEISDEYEKLRKKTFAGGDYKSSELMNKMNDAIVYRMNAEYKKTHPNEGNKTVHHEHGWYLPGDY